MSSFSYTATLNKYDYTGRPGSHLNLGTLEEMIKEIGTSKGINEIEQAVYTIYVQQHYNAYNTAQHLINNSWLSTNKYNVCHKVPISSFLRALRECMNDQLIKKATITQSPWKELVKLYDNVDSANIPSHTSQITALISAVDNNQQHLSCTTAWTMALAFDASHRNLYFGHSTTNSSINDNTDLHYNLVTTTQAPVPPTPRGPSMEGDLQALEAMLGLSLTSEVVEPATGTTGKWAMNSGVYGTKSATTGYVLATP